MSSAAQPFSTLERNKQILIRWFEEVWNQGRRETIFELFPAGILHDGSAQLNGAEEFCSFYDALHAQFQDHEIRIHCPDLRRHGPGRGAEGRASPVRGHRLR